MPPMSLDHGLDRSIQWPHHQPKMELSLTQRRRAPQRSNVAQKPPTQTQKVSLPLKMGKKPHRKLGRLPKKRGLLCRTVKRPLHMKMASKTPTQVQSQLQNLDLGQVPGPPKPLLWMDMEDPIRQVHLLPGTRRVILDKAMNNLSFMSSNNHSISGPPLFLKFDLGFTKKCWRGILIYPSKTSKRLSEISKKNNGPRNTSETKRKQPNQRRECEWNGHMMVSCLGRPPLETLSLTAVLIGILICQVSNSGSLSYSYP